MKLTPRVARLEAAQDDHDDRMATDEIDPAVATYEARLAEYPATRAGAQPPTAAELRALLTSTPAALGQAYARMSPADWLL